MGLRYLPISAVATTALSFVGLQVWTELSLDRLGAAGWPFRFCFLGIYMPLKLKIWWKDLLTTSFTRLDQGLNEASCPTCCKPLFVSRTESEMNPSRGEVLRDEQLARQFERQNNSVHALTTGMFPSETPNSTESDPWRNSGLDSSWLQTWSHQGVDVVGPSAGSRSVGLGQVQMMMRHLASVGEGYAQNALDDASWGLWPMNPSQVSIPSTYVPPAGGGITGGLHLRTVSHAENNMASILAMVETVREALSHVPDEIIFQDLQRTNSVAITVNNLLQMS